MSLSMTLIWPSWALVALNRGRKLDLDRPGWLD
jgi:hypothetical protein